MHSSHTHTLADEVRALTGQDVMQCYQCGKCSGGCPVRAFTDTAPNKVVRFVQLGFDKEALNSKGPWLCAGCLTCSTRCPQEFNLAAFMDAMREIAVQKGVPCPDEDVKVFHTVFLKQIERHGRSYELGLIRDYKLKTCHLMQDVDLAPEMFAKGKMNILPHKVENIAAVRDIVKKAGEAHE